MHVHTATVDDWPVTGLWKRIAEPRVQRATFFVIYLLQITAGMALGFVQPRAVEYEFGAVITTVWSAFFVLGGLLGAIGVFPGWNYVERVGILSLIFAIALCMVVIAYSPWSPAGLEVIIWALVAGWAVVLLYRLWEIRDYAIAPK